MGQTLEDLDSQAEILCLDPDLLAELTPRQRSSVWYFPLAWHPGTLPHPAASPGRVLVLHQSLAASFPGAETLLVPYPLAIPPVRRSDREGTRHRLGITPGRLALFCREESSPLIRVMKALEIDERLTVVSVEDAHLLDKSHPETAEALALSASDLFIGESSPRAVAESLALGTPLAAFVRTDGDLNAGFLADAGAGLVAGRPGDLLMAIDTLAGGAPESAQRLRRALDTLRASPLLAPIAARLATAGA